MIVADVLQAPPTGAQLLRYLYPHGPPWATAIPSVAGETLILHGDPGSGIDEAADWILQASVHDRPVVEFAVDIAGDYDALVVQLAKGLLLGVLGEDAATAVLALGRGGTADFPRLDPAEQEIVKLLVPALFDSPHHGSASRATAGSLASMLRVAPPAVLLVRDAHLLTQRWAHNALWEIRGAIQDDRRHVLVLTCPTEARDSLDGRAAPFFGAGSLAEVGADRDERFWRRVVREHDLPASDADLQFVLPRTWGLAVPTLAVLLDAATVGVEEALRRRARAAVDSVSLAMGLARASTRYGPALLLRLARGARPYGIPSATSRDVSRGLRQLGFNELVARHGDHGWRVADPFLADALLSLPFSPA